MAQFKTKDKVMNSILDQILQHFEESMYNVYTKDFNKILANLKSDDTSPLLKNKHRYICNSIKLHFQKYSVRNLSYHPSQTHWERYLKDLQKRLAEIDNGKLQKVFQHLIICQNHLEILDISTTNGEDFKIWYKRHCKNILKCFNIFYSRLKTSTDNITDYIYLTVAQLGILTKLMKKLFDEEMTNEMILIEIRIFLQRRYAYIFDVIKKTFHENSSPDKNSGFLQWMDNSLDLISELKPDKPEKFQNIKNSIEEVLCHAMSIAQICDVGNSIKIKASIQTILQELNELEKEIGKPRIIPSCITLYTDIVSDKLCILESRVNIAVLGIALKAFAHPKHYLDKLLGVCKENMTKENRSKDDLSGLIKEFDAHVDAITQVGLFAIACSTNLTVTAKISSNLASLESLETELIPAIITYYMEPSQINSCYVDFFAKYWTKEVDNLKKEVCFIIDPLALGKVVYDDLKTNIQSFPSDDPKEEFITPLSDKVDVLLSVYNASINDLNFPESFRIHKTFSDLKTVHREVIAAKKMLAKNESPQISKSIHKRLFILLTMIERLNETFKKENSNGVELPIESPYNKEPSDLINKANDSNLNMLQGKGLEILKNRSILYKTPNKTFTKLPTKTPGSCTSTRHENRNKGVSFIRKELLENWNETLDLQITEILEEITNVADSIK